MNAWLSPALAELARGLEWDGRHGLCLPGERREWTPAGDAEAALTEHLYRRYFCRWRPAAEARASGDPEFVARLTAKAQGATTWDDGWVVADAGPEWAFVINGAIQVFVSDPRDLRPPAAQVGAAVQLRLPCARAGASPGFFFFVGPAGRISDARPHLRLYLNVTPDGAAGVVGALAHDRAARRLFLEAKFVNHPAAYGRVDTGILYVDPGSFDATLSLMRRLERAHPRWWRRGIPPFTYPLGKGTAVAEGAAGRRAESYGENRCRVMARGVLDALRSGAVPGEAWRSRVAAAFAAEGLDLERPYVRLLGAVESAVGIRFVAPGREGPRVGWPAMARPARRRKVLPRLTARLALGRGGLEVSPACLGMVGAAEVVPAAFDAGINFFFVSADMHWPLYEPMRRGLELLLSRGKAVRDRLVVCAAAYVTQPEFCELPFEELVAAVPGLGRIDVVAAGGVYWQDFWARLPVYQAHRAARFCGARAMGASFHDRSAALTAVSRQLVDVAFVRYNAGHPGAQRDLFPLLPARRRTRLFGFKSTDAYVGSGRCAELGVPDRYWVPRVTDHYRFALNRPELDGVLLSLDTVSQVAELSEALAEGPLDASHEKYLVDLAALDQGR